ncbi:hypothetical protein AYO47_00400 [Planctomyces sp. SCGC AG-212-M04]|nr:hypothetical protein AYO47_00400 [Planctomyces sp. SCGC AG-212-M04]
MATKPVNAKRPADTNLLAKWIVDIATDDAVEPKASAKAVSGRKGGQKGGKSRAEKLSDAERRAIAKKAAECLDE